MPEYFLPRLSKDSVPFVRPIKDGWQELPTFGLANLLDLWRRPVSEKKYSKHAASLPDIWSSPLQFAHFLRNQGSPSHSRAVEAFRAFLAILALRLERQYGVSVHTVDLRDNKWHVRFAQTANRSLTFQGLVSAVDPGWNPVSIFLLDGEVLGLTSPLTLVAPSWSVTPRLVELGLIDAQGGLQMPTLSPFELVGLRAWIDGLRGELIVATPSSRHEWLSLIIRRLDEFQRDLEGKAERSTRIEVRFSDESFRLGGIYQPLSKAILSNDQAPDWNDPNVFTNEFIEELQRGNCILYAGAGLSATAGFPTWSDFAQRLANAALNHGVLFQHDRQFIERSLRDQKTDYVVDEIVGRDKGAFARDFVQSTFSGGQPSEAHKVVRSLPFAAVLTTNWDDLIEKAFEVKDRGSAVYIPTDTEALLGALSRREFFVLKASGDPARSEQLFISPAQRDKAVSEDLAFQTILETLFVSRTILFVGCSLEGIETFLGSLRFRSQSNTKHYALAGVIGTSWQATAGVLERRYGIQTIPYRWSDGADQLRALKALQSRITRQGGRKPARSSTFRRMILSNIGPFEYQEIELAPDTNIFLGANGVGKSTVLRAIAVGIAGKDAEPYAKRILRSGSSTGSIELQTDSGKYQTILQRNSTGVEVTSRPVSVLDAEGCLAFGFAPLRSTMPNTGNGRRQAGVPFPTTEDVMPLIRGDLDLRLSDLQSWIAELDHLSKSVSDEGLKGPRYSSLIVELFETLSSLLDGVKVEFLDVDPVTKRVTVLTDDGAVPLDHLSQGSSSVIALVGMMLQRLHEVYGADDNPSQRFVLLLVDEIDAHMHPGWQLAILPKLRQKFPNMQLVATTHSPLIANGLESRNLFHVFRSTDTGAVDVRHYEMNLAGLETDKILTGPLFGLPDTRDLVTQEKEKRYDHLRAIATPTEEELAEKRSLVRELFGARSETLDFVAKAIYRALESRVSEEFGNLPDTQKSQFLGDAEKFIQKQIKKG